VFFPNEGDAVSLVVLVVLVAEQSHQQSERVT
jgi:hypothetical protein